MPKVMGASMGFGLGPEVHTFTMIGRCERTGLLGVCITSSPLSVGARCPFIRANVAALSTQAYSDPGLGPLALNLLDLGHPPEQVLEFLKASDEWSEFRQNGIVDRNGRSAAFTGSENLDWKGHIVRPNYVAMGNYLTGEQVVEAMAKAFEDKSEDILEERLLGAIEAGRDAGGERGGQLSSALVVQGREPYPRTDLRIDMVDSESGDAVDALRRVFNEYEPLISYYEQRPRNPLLESWREWRAKHRS